jgi:hypothetical protein
MRYRPLGILLLAGTISACASIQRPADPRLAQLQETVNRVATMYNMPRPPTVVTDTLECSWGYPLKCTGPLPLLTAATYRAESNEIVLREKLLEPTSMRGLTQVVLAGQAEAHQADEEPRGHQGSRGHER